MQDVPTNGRRIIPPEAVINKARTLIYAVLPAFI